MAAGPFRYPFDIQSTLATWREKLGGSFDDVVAHLVDRDRAMEDYASVHGTQFVTSTTRPPTPVPGQVIFETDTKRLTVWDGSAWSTVPSGMPFVHVTRNANQSINNTTSTAISWDTAQSNPYSMWSAGSPTLITFPIAGLYEVKAGCTYSSNATGERMTDILLGGGLLICMDTRPTSAALNGPSVTLGVTRKFAGGDSIVVRAWQNTGGALNIGEGSSGHERTFCSVAYLGSGN